MKTQTLAISLIALSFVHTVTAGDQYGPYGADGQEHHSTHVRPGATAPVHIATRRASLPAAAPPYSVRPYRTHPLAYPNTPPRELLYPHVPDVDTDGHRRHSNPASPPWSPDGFNPASSTMKKASWALIILQETFNTKIAKWKEAIDQELEAIQDVQQSDSPGTRRRASIVKRMTSSSKVLRAEALAREQATKDRMVREASQGLFEITAEIELLTAKIRGQEAVDTSLI